MIQAANKLWLHVALFLLSCLTTTLWSGWLFSATLMTILLTHEMGHYVMARRHRVPTSLPYFIPVPFPPGTLGAVIRMRSSIGRRDALIDVAAAGPLAGLVMALVLLVVGLVRSEVSAVSGGMVEGNSLLYIGLKLIIKGRYLPAGGVDVHLDGMAFGAWIGLLVTFINLMPIAQLDGGHIATAYFGSRHEQTARILHGLLTPVGLVVMAALTAEARLSGRTWLDSVAYGLPGGAPWLVWALLLVLMRRMSGGVYHPPVDETPLSPSRRWLFGLMVVVFVLLFTPVPMREVP